MQAAPIDVSTFRSYCNSLVSYQRRKSIEVNIGAVPLGGNNPIRIQSMTTVDTMDTLGSVEECIRMANAGCEYIRITAPSIKEAANLENIKKELKKRGYDVPLIADIHFTPNAAELAARLVEKVRINPGNYADKKKFETIQYTEAAYQAELERIREKFVPLVKICKEYGTAMRIGTNHGSLSDRILSHYGDTPLGMVESALEFVRICEDLNYYNLVISMKASNTQVMVQAYRLLVQKLEEEKLKPYPLHLGVTEAGEAEDGRIKSAVGIGTLLEDGLGDTIRVSLTEPPEMEIPVAKALAVRYDKRHLHSSIRPIENNYPINPYQYFRRETSHPFNIGSGQVPRVIADIHQLEAIEMEDLKAVGHFYLSALDKWKMNDLGADFLYCGSKPLPFMPANGTREIIDYPVWNSLADNQYRFPLFTLSNYDAKAAKSTELAFIRLNAAEWNDAVKAVLEDNPQLVVWLYSDNMHYMPEMRRFFVDLLENQLQNPVVIEHAAEDLGADELPLYTATDVGGLLIDGLGDAVILSTRKLKVKSKPEMVKKLATLNQLAFGILQAARTRMSKTEYISCPSCGRTLFDLQETTAMIRKRTDHLKGVKIGIMGCIVNGPGEMADADYGYVGVGKDKIALYRGQNVVKKSVPASQAVDELIELIREDGKWSEPEQITEASLA
jgi:(E)-4-hydroxy-3-methylbut-2-enyl-diphosphate synthase